MRLWYRVALAPQKEKGNPPWYGVMAHESVNGNPKHCGHVSRLGKRWLSCGKYDHVNNDDCFIMNMKMKTVWLCWICQSDHSKDDHRSEGQPSHHCCEHLKRFIWEWIFGEMQAAKGPGGTWSYRGWRMQTGQGWRGRRRRTPGRRFPLSLGFPGHHHDHHDHHCHHYHHNHHYLPTNISQGLVLVARICQIRPIVCPCASHVPVVKNDIVYRCKSENGSRM